MRSGTEAISRSLTSSSPKTFTHTNESHDGPFRGPKGLKGHIAETLGQIFSDTQITFVEQLAEGDRVVTHYVLRGTQPGAIGSLARRNDKLNATTS